MSTVGMARGAWPAAALALALAGCTDPPAQSPPPAQAAPPAAAAPAASTSGTAGVGSGSEKTMSGDGKVVRSEAEWRARLTDEQYRVARCSATEAPFTGKYWKTKDEGTYKCVGCGEPLFSSDAKFDSGTGWPSFFRPMKEGVVAERPDTAHGMVRVEIVCGRCDSHLGHVFDDGPRPTGLRYCVNSASLDLEKK